METHFVLRYKKARTSTTFGKTFPKRDGEAKGRNIKEEILQELMKQKKDSNGMNGGDKEVELGQLPRPPERSRSSSSKSELLSGHL